MEHYDCIKEYFESRRNIHLSSRNIASKLKLGRKVVKHVIWLLKTNNIIRISRPFEVGSGKRHIAVYCCNK